jgi:uncharacterized repeat protein (TIGR03803 family)
VSAKEIFMQSSRFIVFVLALFVVLISMSTAQTHRLYAPPSLVFTSLLSFDITDGSYPGPMSLVQGTDGNFYGVTGAGGAGNSCTYMGGCGTFFKITPQGALTTIYSFCSLTGCADGEFPVAAPVLGTDGDFYGTTARGGPTNNGTVYKITPGGVITTLHGFLGSDGADPQGALAWSGGYLYGTTYGQGSTVSSYGTVFKVSSTSGDLTTLYSFCSQAQCADGSYPYSGLIQASDGNFYGTTSEGGTISPCPSSQENGCGTIFRITPGGTLTTMHSFAGYPADGSLPAANLIQATDLSLYGTTEAGGKEGSGVAFKIALGGAFTMIYSFCADRSRGECLDGFNSFSGVIQGTDGNFYGAALGGENGDGIVYQLTPQRSLTVEHSFDTTDGLNPYGGIVQGTDGSFYGSTQNGGSDDNGTIYNLNLGLAPFVRTLAVSGKVGSSVVILGTNLTGATSVTFNGTAAVFTVVSSSEITATVPTGATTGPVVVTTPSGTLASNKKFRIIA